MKESGVMREGPPTYPPALCLQRIRLHCAAQDAARYLPGGNATFHVSIAWVEL